MQRDGSANKRVFFQREKDFCFEFSGDNATLVSKLDVGSSANSFLFVDNILKDEPISVPRGTVIAFSSPDPQRYREFRKSTKCFELILNPLSVNDIEILYNRLKLEHESIIETGKGTDSGLASSFLVVRRNMEMMGGIPRYVFKSELMCKGIVDKACTQYSKNIFQDLSLSLDSSPTGKEGDLSYRITHMKSIDNIYRTYTFASDYVVRNLFSIYNGAQLRSLVMQVSRDFLGPNVKGYLFESICHSYFIRNAKTRLIGEVIEKHYC